ncbi:MAG: TonB family protein [Xanthobacteraceae bacterium]
MNRWSEFGVREIVRWGVCGCVVLAAHTAVPAWIMLSDPADDANSTAGAIVIELAPMMAAPANDKAELPPGPDQVQSDASVAIKSGKLEEKTEEVTEPQPNEPQTKIAETVKSEIELDSVKPKPVQEQPAPQENQTFAPETTAVQLPRADDVSVAVAPQQTQYNEDDSDKIPEWHKQVTNKLERNKRYPAQARIRGEQGTAYLEFKLDREGHVTESRIIRSSGSTALDQETIELLRRSDPFPKPPHATLKGATVVLAIPLNFKMR